MNNPAWKLKIKKTQWYIYLRRDYKWEFSSIVIQPFEWRVCIKRKSRKQPFFFVYSFLSFGQDFGALTASIRIKQKHFVKSKTGFLKVTDTQKDWASKKNTFIGHMEFDRVNMASTTYFEIFVICLILLLPFLYETSHVFRYYFKFCVYYSIVSLNSIILIPPMLFRPCDVKNLL